MKKSSSDKKHLEIKKGVDVDKSRVKKVTNKTIEQSRNEILRKARKFIYPTRTKRHVVYVSVSLLVAAAIVFLVVCGLLLYKFNNTSTFIYRVTQVVPFPIAKAGDKYVSYENYLFEIRHYKHYYQFRSQQPTDFSTQSGQDQLSRYEHRALKDVVDLAYAKQLARQYNVSVSRDEVTHQLSEIEQIGMLGRNREQLADVLAQKFGWSIADFRRELEAQILQNKLVAKLDVDTANTANDVLTKLDTGASFAKLAAKFSDDKASAGSGGRYPGVFDRSTTDLPPAIKAVAFKLKKGQHSEVINTGRSLEIIKVLSVKNSKVTLAHIQFDLKPIDYFLKPLKAKNPPVYYLHLGKN